MMSESEIETQHGEWLDQLRALAKQAILTSDWDNFYAHLIDAQSENEWDSELRTNLDESEVEGITAASITVIFD